MNCMFRIQSWQYCIELCRIFKFHSSGFLLLFSWVNMGICFFSVGTSVEGIGDEMLPPTLIVTESYPEECDYEPSFTDTSGLWTFADNICSHRFIVKTKLGIRVSTATYRFELATLEISFNLFTSCICRCSVCAEILSPDDDSIFSWSTTCRIEYGETVCWYVTGSGAHWPHANIVSQLSCVYC
jgi:hypothetical protein